MAETFPIIARITSIDKPSSLLLLLLSSSSYRTCSPRFLRLSTYNTRKASVSETLHAIDLTYNGFRSRRVSHTEIMNETINRNSYKSNGIFI